MEFYYEKYSALNSVLVSLCMQVLDNLGFLFTVKTVELKIRWNICGQIMAICEREMRRSLRFGKGM